ncbi:uncharacterized protein LOC120165702 [Hibiscus syriacus]|uniref:uncharacterized protein LOC120165702 n=1 Tax=Hibiscus syriacus TaxID=106335 RepID=UPI001922ADAB|nr:uncharacterized protein LOC120165702 [Hibiscus syriacus]
MAGGVNRKISAASARAHTRKAKQNPSFNLPSGLFTKLLLVLSVGALAWAYQAIQPPPPKLCGSPDGPPVTASRIKLRDGRHLAYEEHGVPRDAAKYKIIQVHGFYSRRLDTISLSPELVKRFGIYIVSFDRPVYGESDPNPKRTVKSMALDIEELADQLRLGSKFYVIGISMGGQAILSCLKYIPHKLVGATLIAPAVNYWWSGLPTNLSNQGFQQQLPQDQWVLRLAHYAPWLTYWWNTQKRFPGFSVLTNSTDHLSSEDINLLMKMPSRDHIVAHLRQQGEYESLHRDMIIGFGAWEFSPVELDNPFPNNEGSVHLWQGDEDKLVPVTLQRYIAQQLPWMHYHELPGAGHMFPVTDGMCDNIVKALLVGRK